MVDSCIAFSTSVARASSNRPEDKSTTSTCIGEFDALSSREALTMLKHDSVVRIKSASMLTSLISVSIDNFIDVMSTNVDDDVVDWSDDDAVALQHPVARAMHA